MTGLLIIAALAVILAALGDMYTTTTFLRQKTAVEGNPVTVWLMRKVGEIPALCIDLALKILIAVLMVLAGQQNAVAAWFALIGLVGVAAYLTKTVIANAKFIK